MSLENDRPESFMGMLMALEGVSDGYTIIHGPTGCKYYPASVSESRFPIREETAETRNMFQFASRYFYSQPRIPCTYLDMGKFITGGAGRLQDLYSKVESLSPSLISIINSPGASLVGENIQAANGAIRTVHIDHSQYSGTFADGYQDGVLEILNVVKPILTKKTKKVNLMGLSIYHLNWKDTINDLSSLLELCGIEVNCTIGAGWSVEDIENSASAALNVSIYPEYCDRIAEFYQTEFDIPYVLGEVPLGFKAIEQWILRICSKVGADPSPGIDRIRETRKKAAKSISLAEAYHMLPKGHTFTLYCDGSTAYSATTFLYDYLGMVPIAVTCPNGEKWRKMTEEFIEEHRIPYSDDALHTDSDIMITSGSLGTSCISRGLIKGFVEIESPGTKYINVRSEPPIGLEGTVILLEKVLNTIAAKQRFL